MTVNSGADDSSVDTCPPARIVQDATEHQPEDWSLLYTKLSSFPHDCEALCNLPSKLSCLFDLITVILGGEKHLAMLTANADNTVTLSHHLCASGSSPANDQGTSTVALLGVIGKTRSAPLLQLRSPKDGAFANIRATTPADSRLLSAAKSPNPHVFPGLELLETADGQPEDLQDITAEVKSFIFVPPAIARKLLQAPTDASPRSVAAAILEGANAEALGVIPSLLRWLWCAQSGLLQPSFFKAPLNPEGAGHILADLKRSYLQPDAGPENTMPPAFPFPLAGNLHGITAAAT